MTRRRTATSSTCSCGPPPGRRPSWTCTTGDGSATTWPSSAVSTQTRAAGRTAEPGRRARRRHRRVDRLCRPPAVGTVRRTSARTTRARSSGSGPATRRCCSASPVARLRLSADAPAASISVKLCDVFPDGTSALITRGSLDLAFRDGVHAPVEPSPLVPGQEYDVEVVLDACAYQARSRAHAAALGRRCRLAEHDRSPGPCDPDRARRLARAAAADRRGAAAAAVHPGRRVLLRGSRRHLVDGDAGTCCARPPRAPYAMARSTTCPTTATPPSSTPARWSWIVVPSPSTPPPTAPTA